MSYKISKCHYNISFYIIKSNGHCTITIISKYIIFSWIVSHNCNFIVFSTIYRCRFIHTHFLFFFIFI